MMKESLSIVESEDIDSERVLSLVRQVALELRPGSRAAMSLDSLLDRDLGLDSLARVELMARLEREFAISLPERALSEAETPRDLWQALRAGTRLSAVAPVLRRQPVAETALTTTGLPEAATTLLEVLDWHVRMHPEAEHIRLHDDESDGESISYAALRDRAVAVAAALQRLDVLPGDSVALMLPTAAEYFYIFFGVLLAGAVPIPIYPPLRRNQLEQHLRRQVTLLGNCSAVAIVTVPEARLVAGLLRGQVESLRHVLTWDDVRDGSGFESVGVAADDTAFIQYTSGSTGDPKGVVLTHANLLANVRADGIGLEVTHEDVFVSWLPLYHDMGLIGAWFGTLYHGVRLVIMSPLDFLQRPARWLQAIHRYGGTLSAAPNFAYELCLRRVEDEEVEGIDLSGWRLALNGAEPISAATLAAFIERFSAYGFRAETMLPVYGLAECSVGLAFPPLGKAPRIDRIQRSSLMRGVARAADRNDANAQELVACGRPLPGHEIRIVDASGLQAPERHVGELQFRGPSATSGYHRSPAHTAALFDGDWLRTGDLAYIADNDLFIAGRIKETIIRAGRNIHPAELEQAVAELPRVRRGRVVVFGATDQHAGTEKLVVLAEIRELDESGREQLRERIVRVASALIDAPPDDIVLAPPNTVPKTSSGKLRRTACREMYEQGRLQQRPRALWWQVARLAISSVIPRVRRGVRDAAAALYGVYAWTVGVALLPAAWLCVTFLRRPEWRWAAARFWLRLARRLIALPLRVESAAPVAATAGGCVVVANHQSYFDACLLVDALDTEVVFIAKQELKRSIFTHWPLRALGTIFVERDTQSASEQTESLLEQLRLGHTIVIFAEGTFKRMPGLLPFRMGAFVTAASACVPVIPVAINGARYLMREGSLLPRRRAVEITVGAPQPPVQGDDAWSSALIMRDRAREYILRHCAEPDLEQESNRVGD